MKYSCIFYQHFRFTKHIQPVYHTWYMPQPKNTHGSFNTENFCIFYRSFSSCLLFCSSPISLAPAFSPAAPQSKPPGRSSGSGLQLGSSGSPSNNVQKISLIVFSSNIHQVQYGSLSHTRNLPADGLILESLPLRSLALQAVFFLLVGLETRLPKSSIYDLLPFLVNLQIRNFLAVMRNQVVPMEGMELEMLEDRKNSFEPLDFVLPIHKLA